MSRRRFIGIIETIVVAVAHVDPRNTISVIARKQIAETRSILGLALILGFVASVLAVLVAVAIPSGGYASMIGTSERVGRTRPFAAVQRIFVAVVAAVVVTVAQPVRFDADGRVLAAQVVFGARHVSTFA